MTPLIFQPLLKQARWGGRRLITHLDKNVCSEDNYAESWEISDHGVDQTIVLQGEYQGWSLHRLVKERGKELLGQHASLNQFPLLIKFLDAQDRLSLQVHPNDQQVKVIDEKENGKTEAWVIIDAMPDSRLYTGLKEGVTRAILAEALLAGTSENCLHSYKVNPGDVVFNPAGTVHAIGEGILLAEIQQSSDLTFRLFDWGRLGIDGKPRDLHIDEGLACIDFELGVVHTVLPAILSEGKHCLEELIRCEQFIVRRHQATIPFRISTGSLSEEKRFRILTTLEGKSSLQVANEEFSLSAGSTILIPASCADVTIRPQPDVLLIESFLP